MLIDRLKEDLKVAMIEKDTPRKNAIRALRADLIELERVNKRPLTEEEATGTVIKHIKMLKEGVEAFEKGGRADLAKDYQLQLEALNNYLPKQYTEEEVEEIIFAKIELGLDTSNKGKMLKELMPLFADQTDKAMIMRVITRLVSK